MLYTFIHNPGMWPANDSCSDFLCFVSSLCLLKSSFKKNDTPNATRHETKKIISLITQPSVPSIFDNICELATVYKSLVL